MVENGIREPYSETQANVAPKLSQRSAAGLSGAASTNGKSLSASSSPVVNQYLQRRKKFHSDRFSEQNALRIVER